MGEKFLETKDSCIFLERCSIEYLIITAGKWINLFADFDQMIKFTVITNETNLHHVLCNVSLTQYCNCVISLPKLLN